MTNISKNLERLLLAFMLILSVSLVACSNDDDGDDDTDNNALIAGTWVTQAQYVDDVRHCAVICANGTGVFAENYSTDAPEVFNFTFTYNPEAKTVTVIEHDGDTVIYTGVTVTGTALSMIDPDGNALSFNRVNEPRYVFTVDTENLAETSPLNYQCAKEAATYNFAVKAYTLWHEASSAAISLKATNSTVGTHTALENINVTGTNPFTVSVNVPENTTGADVKYCLDLTFTNPGFCTQGLIHITQKP